MAGASNFPCWIFPQAFARVGSSLVRKEGLEPPCLSALEPKSSASTNSATFAVAELYPKRGALPAAGGRARRAYNRENSIASIALAGRPLRELPGRLVAAAGAHSAAHRSDLR